MRAVFAQIPFEFVCLPSSRHGPSTPSDRRLFRRRLISFFAEALLPPSKHPRPCSLPLPPTQTQTTTQ